MLDHQVYIAPDSRSRLAQAGDEPMVLSAETARHTIEFGGGVTERRFRAARHESSRLFWRGHAIVRRNALSSSASTSCGSR